MDTAPSTLKDEKNPELQAVVVRREPERDLVTWTAPARPFKRRNRQYFVNVFAIAGITSLVVFFAEGVVPVILIVALIFLFYVLSTVPPEDIEYKITSYGVRVAGKLTGWQDVSKFWFGKRMDTEMLFFETLMLPGRMEIVIKQELKDDLKKELSAYLPFEETAPHSKFDKTIDWLGAKLQGKK